MDKPIRILHVLGQLEIGGAESRIMDIYRTIDRDRVQFDFVVHFSDRGYFEDEVEALGGRIFRVPRFKFVNYFSYKKAWKKLLDTVFSKEAMDRCPIKYVQGHMTSTAGIYLPLARKYGAKTIAHARSAGVDKGIKGVLTRLLRKNLDKKADYLFTCSNLAAISVFGEDKASSKDVVFIPNAINVSKFKFNANVKNDIRSELKISDKYVFGHVGSFRFAKNHEYLIRIFNEIIKLFKENDLPDPVLILLGDGARRPLIEKEVSNMGLDDKVFFLGVHEDSEKYYSAMDCFLYPSRYEGMPGTVVEAQASGLRVLMSDKICDEVVSTDLVDYMSIEIDPALWAREALKIAKSKPYDRTKYNEEVAGKGFEVTAQTRKLTEFYESGRTDSLDQ